MRHGEGKAFTRQLLTNTLRKKTTCTHKNDTSETDSSDYFMPRSIKAISETGMWERQNGRTRFAVIYKTLELANHSLLRLIRSIHCGLYTSTESVRPIAARAVNDASTVSSGSSVVDAAVGADVGAGVGANVGAGVVGSGVGKGVGANVGAGVGFNATHCAAERRASIPSASAVYIAYAATC
jgi:hypothetical protein